MELKHLVLTDDALNAIEKGTWVGDFDGHPDLAFKVLGWQSKESRDANAKEQEAARIANGGKPLDKEQFAACTRKVLADVILQDWRGLTDNGKPVKFDKAKAKEWLTSPNGERLAAIVLSAAQRVDANVYEYIEEASKN